MDGRMQGMEGEGEDGRERGREGGREEKKEKCPPNTSHVIW